VASDESGFSSDLTAKGKEFRTWSAQRETTVMERLPGRP
jgi:hypothetical protein